MGKEGYCTYFASAMTVLCRMAGLPARYVEGFVAQPGADGFAYVTGKDAHAWTEVYFEGFGWVPFDATPQQQEMGGDNQQDQQQPEPSPSPSPTPSPQPPEQDQQEEPTPSPDPQPQQDPESPRPRRTSRPSVVACADCRRCGRAGGAHSPSHARAYGRQGDRRIG